MTDSFDGGWLAGTYWYVPEAYLPAVLALNAAASVTTTLADQTVWKIDGFRHGYVTGISATNVGQGWSYMLIAGSIAPNRAVKLSFAPRDGSGALTIGDGTVETHHGQPAFLMQMTSGSVRSSVTHWAYMLQVKPTDPEWRSLPGYPDTGIADLTGLQTPILNT